MPPDPPVKDAAGFEALVHAVFTRRRKTLGNALLAYRSRQSAPTDRLPAPHSALTAALPPAAAALQAADIDGRRRPETLTVAELVRLADAFVATAAPRYGPSAS